MIKEKISIIVPVYNVEKYLSFCIDSIINQTYKNIEILLIDDGSTDTSPKICDDYVKKDNRILTYHIKNGGVSNARNFGMKKASGKWITFVDSDDVISKDYCTFLIDAVDKSTDMIIGRTISFLNDNLDNFLDDRYNGGECDIFKTIEQKENLFKSILVDNYKYIKYPHISTCSAKLINMEIIKKYKLNYNEKICLYEDAIFNMNVIFYSRNVKVINKKIYYYRTRNASSSNQFNLNSIKQYDNVYDEIKKFEKEKNIELSKYLDYFKVKNLNILLTNYCKNNTYKRNTIKSIISNSKDSLTNLRYSFLPKKRQVLKFLTSIKQYYLIYLIYMKGK